MALCQGAREKMTLLRRRFFWLNPLKSRCFLEFHRSNYFTQIIFTGANGHPTRLDGWKLRRPDSGPKFEREKLHKQSFLDLLNGELFATIVQEMFSLYSKRRLQLGAHYNPTLMDLFRSTCYLPPEPSFTAFVHQLRSLARRPNGSVWIPKLDSVGILSDTRVEPTKFTQLTKFANSPISSL